MSLSVVVVHHRGREILGRCLESLAAQLYGDFEVILVANGVTDGSVDPRIGERLRLKTVTLDRNAGFAGGANAGIRAATGDFVALLNDDAAAEPGWTAALLEAADAYPWASSFASCVLTAGGALDGRIDSAGDLLTRFGEGANRGRGEPDGPPYDTDAEVFGASAGASMYRRAFFDRIGLFDERFFHSYEDFDLSVRARVAGERCLFVSGARVHHIGAVTRGASSPDSIFHQARNSEFVFWSALPAGVLWQTLPWHMLRSAWGVVAQGRRGLARPYLLGKLAALAELPRLLASRRERLSGAVSDLRSQVDGQWHLGRAQSALARLDIRRPAS